MNKGDDRSRYDFFRYSKYTLDIYSQGIQYHDADWISRFISDRLSTYGNGTTIGIRPLLQVKFAIKNGFRVNNEGARSVTFSPPWWIMANRVYPQHFRPNTVALSSPDLIDFSTVPSFPTRYSLGQFSILLS